MTWSLITEPPFATLIWDRPPQARMPLAGLRELDDLVQSVGHDETVSVIILASAQLSHFPGRADRGELDRLAAGEALPEGMERWMWTALRLESAPQPVIAAVGGEAFGGGCELSLACTFRVGTERTTFSQIEVGVGGMPGAGGTQRLPRLIGPARAARMILTSSVIDAREALTIGLLDAIVDEVDYLDAVRAWAAPLVDKRRDALVDAKRALVEAQRLPLLDGLLAEQRLFMQRLRRH